MKNVFWKRTITTSIIAALLLVVTSSAVWVNRYIFDADNFTDIAVASVTSESSRQALASGIVDRALADRPVVRNVAGGTATKLIGSLLATDQFETVLSKSVEKIHVYLTSSNQESVTLNLSGIKNTVTTLINVAGRSEGDAANRIENVPDEITLVDANNIPDFYKYGLVFLWLGPISGLLALALLVYPYLKDKSRYYLIAATQGAALAVAGLASLLLGPLFKPPLLAQIPAPGSRTVVSNLYDAFIATFNHQAMHLVWAGVVLAVVPFAVHEGLKYYGRYKAKPSTKKK